MSYRAAKVLGPLLVDIAGPSLTDHERGRLAQPLVGGVVLFDRNFVDVAQLGALITELHALRQPPLLVTVDHEGGRVQRWRDGFSKLPSARELGRLFDEDRQKGLKFARALGRIIGAETADVGVDLVFAPVVDVDHSISEVIADRAFHRSPEVVAALGREVANGIREAGVGAVAKHFPGHGGVAPDTHVEIAVDDRTSEALFGIDLVPYNALMPREVDGVMLSHVIYPALDEHPAGFSRFWVSDMLRRRFQFDGLVLTDDLAMAAVASRGSLTDLAQRSLLAGCDLVIVCNDPESVDECLEQGGLIDDRLGAGRRHRRKWATPPGPLVLRGGPQYMEAKDLLDP